MKNLTQHSNAYKKALLDDDTNTLLQEKACLTSLVASALLEQDTKSMREVRACITHLYGHHWQSLGEVLTLAIESGNPLEQLRLALPSKISGQILICIKNDPGTTATIISNHLHQEYKHICSKINILENNRLLYKQNNNGNCKLFMSAIGSEILESTMSCKD